MNPFFPWAAALLTAGRLLAQEPPQGTALDHITTRQEWVARRAQIVAAMESVMGPLPTGTARSPLEPRIEQEVDCGDHIRRLITYQSEPGGRTPAYLLLPKTVFAEPPSQLPAVLCLHPTNAQLGNEVIVRAHLPGDYPYALELVQRGFVVIAPAYPLMAKYQPNLQALGYASGTMKAVWDNIRALDYLETLPFVQKGAFGAIGHSLGGHNALFTAVFEPRIHVVISSCGFDSFQDYYHGAPRVWQQGSGWTQERYMPRLAQYAGRLSSIPFDFDGVLAALAPRHVLVSAPVDDLNFRADSVDRLIAAARPVFTMLGAGENLDLEHPAGAHGFSAEMRARAYQLLERELPPQAARQER